MTLTTPVDIAPSDWTIGLEDRILLLGSCFSDRIADPMREHYLRVTANPTGTLYNPVSIAHHIDEYAPQADVIIITFGTAWVYIDKYPTAQRSFSAAVLQQSGLSSVVDNCEKRPATDFIRRRLTVEEIVSLWQPIIERYADKRWIFTVSPIRHKKDGLHENQISKGILLQAVENLVRPAQGASVFEKVLSERTNKQAVQVQYFPSYEILLDELRDYRFYASDLVHPSPIAIDVIWERFCATYFMGQTLKQVDPLHQLWLDEHHRPLHPDSPEAAAFAKHIQKEREALHQQFPSNV